MAPYLPEPRQCSRQTQPQCGFVTLRGPIQRRSQVAMLGREPVHPCSLPRPSKLRLSLLREAYVEPQVALSHCFFLSAFSELTIGILPHHLEQPIPPVVRPQERTFGRGPRLVPTNNSVGAGKAGRELSVFAGRF